jgi:hypothetical protein
VSQPLWYKLEKTLSLLAASVASDEYRNTLGKPKKSMFTKVEEEEDD